MHPFMPRAYRWTSRSPLRRIAVCIVAAAALAAAISPGLASAARATTSDSGHSLASNTRFYTPPPASGSIQQIATLLADRQTRGAALIARMERISSAVWLDGETRAQVAEGVPGELQANADVARQVKKTLIGAKLERAVPIFVTYNVPGRDCSQYSAGGAPSNAAYESWIGSIRSALSNARAVLILEPDALTDLPAYCGGAYRQAFPDVTNTSRINDVAYGVRTLERDPNISLYLDAGHSAWQPVGNIAQVLLAADLQQAQGFFLNVSNYQYATNDAYYGTWVSSCLAYATKLNGETRASALADASHLSPRYDTLGGAFASCPNQYWNGGPASNWTGVAMSPDGVWSERQSHPYLSTAGIDSRYASMLGTTRPTTHFVIDTSRDGRGPNNMRAYAAAPYDQPAGVFSVLQRGSWCNPPGAGLGFRPTAHTGAVTSSLDSYLPAETALLDAYLWVKTPGQSDGRCDIAGGVRAWLDYAPTGNVGGDTPDIPDWPSSASANWTTFDPLWSLQTGSVVTDPAAGAWFPAQALELAKDASPRLNG